MKKIVTCICAVMFALCSFATPQEFNVIYIDGEAWGLLTEPMFGDSALYGQMKALLPKDRIIRSSNWNGYTSYWSIKKGCLYLDSIRVEFYNEEKTQKRYECLEEGKMRNLFKGYKRNKGVLATWFTDTLSVARGDCLRYYHSGYGSVYEYETLFAIENGRVKERNDYHNRVIDGFSFESRDLTDNQDRNEILAKLAPLIDKYPELAHAKRILFSFKNVTMDASGHVVNCTVTAKVFNGGDRPEEHKDLAEDMKQAIMAIHPWKMIYLRGKYVSYALEGYTIPFVIK